MKTVQLSRTGLALVAAALLAGCEQMGTIAAKEPEDAAAYRPVAITADKAAQTRWQGRAWRVNAGVLIDPALAYAVQSDAAGRRIRFELRDTPFDRSPRDSSDTRRAEISGSLYGDKARLPNGVPLWGAVTFRHHAWTDPSAMRELKGGVYGQIHMGSRFGGSPALAFRRSADGKFRITTRGQFDAEGTVQAERAVSFDQAHDLVYRVVLDPAAGSLTVWLDGERILDRQGISIGHENADSFWNLGLYFSGGIRGCVVAEYANHAYPSPTDLRARVHRPPGWPD